MNVIGRGRLHPALVILALLSLAFILASCTSGESRAPGAAPGASVPPLPGTPELPAPSPTPEILSEIPHPISRVSPSLEEQIYASEFIVRASLISVSAGVETVPSGPGVAPTYRALQTLRFTAHEYLKGSGPDEVVVIVRGRHTHLTEAEARVFADLKLMQRNTAWDDRQGVLFLNLSAPTTPVQEGGAGSQNEAAFEFTLSNFGVETEWDYSIDTLSRAWLPAVEAGQPDADSTDTSLLQFTTGGSASPSQPVSLAELRSDIADMEDTLEAGAGVHGFAGCIRDKIRHERHQRAVPFTPYQHSIALSSGLPAGTEILRVGPFYEDPNQWRSWFTGKDYRLFQTSVEDVDSNPRYGYDRVIAVLRPLPAGSYRFEYRVQHDSDARCGFIREPYLEGAVTVIPAAGTVHEAFFDPAATSAAIGFTASAGRLGPAAFSVNGVQTSIDALTWERGMVTLALSPVESLPGGRIDFIAIDGSVFLSLAFDDAQPHGADTLTWSVPHQPWRAGDRLMIRVQESAR